MRNWLKNPAVAWTFATVCLALAIWFLARSLWSKSDYDLGRLSESVTVRFTDTNDETHMTRADFEDKLRSVPGVLTAETGIVNPKTGKPTGVLVATKEWNATIDRINAEREWAKHNSPFGGPPQQTQKR